MHHVYVLRVAGDVVLLPFLQHIAVQGSPYAGGEHHAHGNHRANPRREVFVGHTLGGECRYQRVEEHHARGTDDDGVLHPLVQPCALHLEIHEHGGQSQEQESGGEEVLEVHAFHAEPDGGDATDEVAQHRPVAQRCVLVVVQLHPDAREYVDEQRTGVQHHQQEVEQEPEADGAQLEDVELVIGIALGQLHVDKQASHGHCPDCRPSDGGVVVPVEHFAVGQYVDEAHQRDAEDGRVAELPEVDGKTAGGILVVGHRDERNQDAKQQQTHHEVIDVSPFVPAGEPCGEPGAQLSQHHEEEVDGRLCGAPFDVQLVPSFAGGRLVAGGNLVGGFHVSGVFDEGEQVDHHQHHAQESHEQAAQCQQEDAVRLGADVAEDVHQRESGDAHHLLPADAHQPVEEGAEGRHADGGGEVGELDMFGLDAQPANHFRAAGGVGAAYRKDGQEEHEQDEDAYRLGHPVVERIVLGIGGHWEN